MPKITSVEPQKKNLSAGRQGPKRFNVYLDGEFAFGADEDLVVNRRLVVGKIFSQEDLENFLFEAEVGKLMERMYRWFALRQHSEKEVRDYFGIKNYELRIKGKEEKSQIVIDALIEKLKQKGLINDLEFAKAWVEARRKSKQKGLRAIKAELFQKGIDREIIEEVTRVESLESSEEELAKLALEKKMRIWKNLDPKKLYQKSIEFLLRKGFDYQIVKNVLNETFKSDYSLEA